ncbi:Carnitine O-palmitoyltransferase 2, mitochondrial [Seminavis robusta]|uniref:Carnitine O-palmitoyltransferase 2, mitochondrial n=1 Tax=Seminavis robusta TaxID=568900 RepID=A0A9N8EVH2_9STRA|nr:Carnitine O-palmitoyltransferase 2, mitochondrial [Seminavis robusta]|eukprot:Sro1683_g290920.1 Carnitine O-palmitoyltransferase 2, mitochondrial (703) ;mRNA; f:8214-10528
MQRLVSAVSQKMTPRLASPTTSTNFRAVGIRNKVFSNNRRVLSSSLGDRTLTPWDVAKWDCHGDYRQEASWEDPSKPLYQHQNSLPRLPIPKVEETLERFLPTALPLAETPQEAESLQKCVQNFAQESTHLQERLLQHNQEYSPNSSWLQHWWNTLGYLQVRDRSPINVSYFFQLKDDPTCFVGDSDVQIKRGAALLWHTAEYRYKVCSGTMPAETVGKKKIPLCSTAFKYMFHACRIPQKDQDAYRIYDPSRHTHAIVACKGHFFAVDFLDQQGNVIPVSVLEQRLQQCVDMAHAQVPLLELGWMTAANRDEWAQGRKALLDAGGVAMETALEKLESGAMVLNLDVDEAPVSRDEGAYLWLHGMNPLDGDTKPCNRWFDKSIQLIVAKNGKTGFLGEHTMMDGMPLVGFAEHVAKHSHQEAVEGSAIYNGNVSNGGVENIFQAALPEVAASPAVQKAFQEAKEEYTKFVQAHTIEVQSFQAYGSDFIKKAGFSPDAYVQIAMQLATYRLWGKQAGTYEATQTRTFLHGRTETTRTVSTESAAFCGLMGPAPQYDEHVESIRKKKLETLHAAVTAHVKYMGKAASGQGVDRHFLGLSMCAKEGESIPALYSDPVFARSKRWRVSTSNLTHPLFENWGYGEVVPDGLGLSYSVHPRFCMFNVTSLKEHEWSTKACQLLEEALLEMRALVEMDQQMSNPPKSKL